ncbi:YraN family protein [Oceanisphaera avium]|uniref:UPF0102 protein CBP12_12255 n=1 Tax=Oceanisphaera avium TaxID=1903694 RepID=A0A1Y0D0R9_9GAMM|nr:YraN family protein [Oceanisphaera avium]ART80834.1 YraN family protein [Oceanisphaera avium]
MQQGKTLASTLSWKLNLKKSSNKTPDKRHRLPSSQEVGDEFEHQAEQFLLAQGLVLIQRNYWCKLGEIDLIMASGDTLVFIEVRYRRQADFGGALASITPAKQQKLRRAALNYMQAQRLNEAAQACRFDVIAFEGSALHWLENAF